MNNTKKQIRIVSAIVLLSIFLTLFFYIHETLPKPIRVVTALFETPVAIVSGLSYYLKLGIDVYDTPWAVILTNLIFSVVLVILADKFFKRRKLKRIT
jgi:ABC-type multidrug transport system permease subunit